MLKLIPRYKQGNKSPDHDPNNPYHYHTEDGKKVVITSEDWEANVGKPYFREIEAAVRAEQAAHPAPEYEINPAFVRDLRSTYLYNMGNGYLNYKYFGSALPQGYSFTDEGLIVDPQGNYYVQSGYRQSPRFTYNINSPLQFTINKGKPIEKTLTFYPVNMDKRVKAPLPVDRTLDVESEREKAIHTYMNNSRVSNNKPTTVKYYTFHAPSDRWSGLLSGELPDILGEIDELKREGYIVSSEPHATITVPYDLNRMKKEDPNLFEKFRYILSSSVYLSDFGPRNFNYDPRYEKYKVLNRPSRQEAEKKAVISIGPLERIKSNQRNIKYFLIKHNLESGKSDSTEYKTLREMSNAFNTILLLKKLDNK